MLAAFSSFVFTTMFVLLGVQKYPAGDANVWRVTEPWKKAEFGYETVVTSKDIVSQCARQPEKIIIFPQIIHSYHEFRLDGRLIKRIGSSDFSKATPFYEQQTLTCQDVLAGRELQWKVATYSEFFSRIRNWPEIADSAKLEGIFGVVLNISAFGILLILSIFTFLIYRRRVSDELTYSVCFGSLVLSGYFLNVMNSYFGVGYGMLTAHKLADSSLWLGGILFVNAFAVDGLIPRRVNIIFRVSAVLGIAVILLGKDGDQVQLGTVIPSLPFIVTTSCIVVAIWKKFVTNGFSKGLLLKAGSITLFTAFGVNDLLSVSGIIDSQMLLSVGIVSGVFGLSIAVNQEIERTYEERDSLLVSLEQKVVEKTKTLEDTLSSLKSTQAELVQSARLASLGTLSAGVAHEINNSINYVNGALIPLEKLLARSVPPEEQPKIKKLLAAIKDGTQLTVEIVKSLRNYTGLNQSEFKDVDVRSTVQSVLTILKSKVRLIKVDLVIGDECVMHGNLVGINQIFMNLITNAVDALEKVKDPTLTISAKKDGQYLLISVRDNGVGIPDAIASRIFDPFFTTKEVGSGTGLGLHIVVKEVERHKGTVTVESKIGQGTSFNVRLPIGSDVKSSEKAA